MQTPRAHFGPGFVRHHFLLAAAAFLAAVIATSASFGPAYAAGDPPAKDPRFEKLKSLAGVWVGMAAHGDSKDSTQVTYRLTGAGSAVMEILFEGSEHEMVTIYHQDGTDVMLTHYCAAGNQPRMKAVPGEDPNVLRFEFAGATNMASPDAMHMHDAVVRFLDNDHIESVWTSYKDGKPAGEAKFVLHRKA